MKKKGLQKGILSVVLIQAMLCTGCALLPKEKEIVQVVTVQPETIEEYEMAEVKRAQVQLTQPVYCKYSQLKEEQLSFAAEGRRVKYVYVEIGDSVKAGDILAKMDIDDLEQSVAELDHSIERNQLQLQHTLELKEFDLQQAKKDYQAGRIGASEYKQRQEQIEASYQETIQNYEDTLYIAELRLERYQTELQGSVLYAGIDGTVSYIRGGLEGSRIAAGTNAITIIDSSQCAFQTNDMEYAEYFKAGDKVTLLNSNGTEYETTVMSAEEAPDTEHVYLALDELDFTLAVGTRATATLVLEQREDVLSLPKSAVHHAGNTYYVFIEDENGLKQVKYVTVGLNGDKLYEITGGLSEGEIVIKK